MKRTVFFLIALSFIAGPIAMAQNESDMAYIKAMQANNPQERAALLKDFLAKFGGKGVQYENFANAYLCATLTWPGKTDAETTGYGEKALALGGLDDATKADVLAVTASVYAKQAATSEKAKALANQLIQHVNATKGKEAEAGNAAKWNQVIGAAHFILGQASDKSKDYKGAVDEYFVAYNTLKSPAVLTEIKKLGKSLVDSGNVAEAEKVYRATYAALKDNDSLILLSQLLSKQGKTQEALGLYKELFAKTKTGETAYNIGVTLAREAKTNPAMTGEAIRYLLDCSVLGTKKPDMAKQAMGIAEGLFYGQDKEWNNRVKAIQESNKLIEDWVKTLNDKYKDKDPEELTPDQKREFRRLNENIDKEKKIVSGIQAEQKKTMDAFQKLIAEARLRNGR